MYPPLVPAVNIYAGDSITFPTYVVKENDVPVNLTGYTNWVAQWRPKADSTEFIALTVVTNNLDDGEFTITATPEQTEAMGVNGVFDVQATGTGGEIRTFIYGTTKWRKDVTRV